MLWLLPNDLGASQVELLPPALASVTPLLDGLIAESERVGRRFLSRYPTSKPAREIPIALMKGREEGEELDFLLAPLHEGEVWGVLSDAGLPAVADPGSRLVARAREVGLAVKALPGPSSIFLGLMLSGFSGQRFAFHGYLPRQPEKALRQWEHRSAQEGETQIFIEAPYRNQHTYERVVHTLKSTTQLALALDLTLSTEEVHVASVAEWREREETPSLQKRCALFLFSAHSRGGGRGR